MEHCPLCPTRPGGVETEIPEADYHIAVFENRFPSYSALTQRSPGDADLEPPSAAMSDPHGGRCEVVCYTSRHDSSLGALPLDQIRDLIEVWRDRTAELSRLPAVRYVYVFENRGEEIGVTLSHPHGQIYAYPFIPPLIQRELSSEAAHWRRTRRCLYCDLLARESTGIRTVIHDEHFIAFVPPFNRWPYEVHVAPRAHVGDLLELSGEQGDSFASVLKDLLQRYDRLFAHPLAYVMAMHQRPVGRGWRHHHFHVEFYPPNRTADRLKYLAGSELGAGAFILDARAEDTARNLRDA